MSESAAYPIEGADYWIQYKTMPPKIYAFVCRHGCGTYTIFLDPRRSYDQQLDDYCHEIMHILNDDFFSDKPILIIEGIA